MHTETTSDRGNAATETQELTSLAWASYNITNDRLFFHVEERLSDEVFQQSKRAGFVYWHGSKRFTCTWRPTAEDFIRDVLKLEITEDDEPDDAESRVARFEKYAEKHLEKAEQAANYRESGRANTERRRRLSLSSENHALGAAEHWKRRIEGAIHHAAYKEQPRTILRRIIGLKTALRRNQKHLDDYTSRELRCGAEDRNNAENLEAGKKWVTRWIAHLEDRITYETALFQANGGQLEALTPVRKKPVQPKGPAKNKAGSTIEFLGAVAVDYFAQGKTLSPESGKWRLVAKVNRSTVDLLTVSPIAITGVRFFVARRGSHECHFVMTAAEVKAQRPDLLELWERFKTAKARTDARAEEIAAERAKAETAAT